MSTVFSLSAECGLEQKNAERFSAHFPGQMVRRDGTVHPLRRKVLRSGQNGFWCVVEPGGVSTRGIHCEREQEDFLELAQHLLELLKTAPAYRYAMVGVGAQQFREFNELEGSLSGAGTEGLVVSEAVCQMLGMNPAWVPFAAGYFWHPLKNVC